MKKAAVAGAAVILVIAVAAFYTACWMFRTTPVKLRQMRREASLTIRKAAPEDMTAALKALDSKQLRRIEMGGAFPFVRIYTGRAVSPDFVAGLTEESFIRLCGTGRPTDDDVRRMKTLLAFAKELVTRCTRSEANALNERILDALFLTGDYDGTVAMLRNGLPGRSAVWIEGTIAKIEAHKAVTLADRAEAAGDKAEAAKQLRKAIDSFLQFCKMISNESNDGPPDCDPATGVAYSHEWMCGKNYRRCADLSRRMGDTEGAERLMNQALESYKIALVKAADDPKSLATLKDEVKPLGL